MADAVARRQARRRKILQNSETRMNRLLGSVSSEDASTTFIEIQQQVEILRTDGPLLCCKSVTLSSI
jgi:hypothetical protein